MSDTTSSARVEVEDNQSSVVGKLIEVVVVLVVLVVIGIVVLCILKFLQRRHRRRHQLDSASVVQTPSASGTDTVSTADEEPRSARAAETSIVQTSPQSSIGFPANIAPMEVSTTSEASSALRVSAVRSRTTAITPSTRRTTERHVSQPNTADTSRSPTIVASSTTGPTISKSAWNYRATAASRHNLSTEPRHRTTGPSAETSTDSPKSHSWFSSKTKKAPVEGPGPTVTPTPSSPVLSCPPVESYGR